MPGAYALTDPNGIPQLWKTRVPPDLAPNYNARPKQLLPIICNDSAGEVRLAYWSLIPPWEKTFATKDPTFNAREDWLAKGRMYGPILKAQRCLVPASGYFEWAPIPGSAKKQPMWLQVVGQPLVTFAGLFSDWKDPATGELRRSFTIITTPPNEVTAAIRDQMPAILPAEARSAWLTPEPLDASRLMPLLRPYRGRIEAYEVSDAVNRGVNGPECMLRK